METSLQEVHHHILSATSYQIGYLKEKAIDIFKTSLKLSWSHIKTLTKTYAATVRKHMWTLPSYLEYCNCQLIAVTHDNF